MSDYTSKISELNSLVTGNLAGEIPLSLTLSSGTLATNKIKLSQLRDLFDFDSAYSTVEEGIAATVENQMFYVYVDSNKLSVNEYVRTNIGANAVIGKSGTKKTIYIPALLKHVKVQVESFAALREFKPWWDGQVVYLKGYYEGSTSGGGEFVGHFGTNTDDGGVVASGAGFYWERAEITEITTYMFGITEEGDHTAILQKMIDKTLTGRLVINHMLNITRVVLKTGINLLFKGTDSGITSTGTTSPIYAVDSTDIVIEGGLFKRASSNYNAVIMTRCHRVDIKDNRTAGLCLLYTGEPAYVYSSIATISDLCSDFKITNNRIDGTYTDSSGTITHSSGINLRWITDVIVESNVVLNTRHGILWWGGDSNVGKDGAAANTRWAQRITIVGNVVNSCEMGGIWGSMGISITVAGNTVEGCYDVGIDFEGCIDSTADGNVVKNCSYGCLTTFFYTKNILFSNNICTLDGVWTLRSDTRTAKQLTNHLNGASNPLADSDVTFRGNKFNYLGTETTDMGKVGATPLKNLVFENNEFLNVIMSFAETTQNGTRVIVGNRLYFTKVLTTAFTAINLKSNTGAVNYLVCQVERNTIFSTSAQLAGSIGIYSGQDYFNGSLQTFINDNVISGFPTSISIVDSNTNTGISHFWKIYSNTVSGSIENNSPVNIPRKGSWLLKNNIDFTGGPVPKTIPVSMRWIKNQRIELSAVSGGYLEAVCVTAGRMCTVSWAASTTLTLGDVVYYGGNVYYCSSSGTTGTTGPSHITGTVINGTASLLFIDTLAVFKSCNPIT